MAQAERKWQGPQRRAQINPFASNRPKVESLPILLSIFTPNYASGKLVQFEMPNNSRIRLFSQHEPYQKIQFLKKSLNFKKIVKIYKVPKKNRLKLLYTILKDKFEIQKL